MVCFPCLLFFRSLQRASMLYLPCLLKLSIFDDALWILHIFQVTIEARYKPSETWRFIIAPIFSFHSNYKLTQKIIEFLWLYLFYFSVFLLGFQKLGEQANISSSFRRLFVFLFLNKLVNGFLQSWKALIVSLVDVCMCNQMVTSEIRE